MHSLKKFLWFFFALALFLFFGQSLVKKVTGGFMVHKILCQFPSEARWDSEPLASEETIQAALNQKFRYFSKGSQMYAFASEDGQYVLKFFNQAHHKKDYPNRRENDFSNTLLAFRMLKEDTGILFVHLCSEKPLNKTITLVDACHIEHQIDLDKTEFLLQKQMKMPFDLIQDCMKSGNEKQAKETISALFTFLQNRLDMGLIDKDPKLYTNYGFIGQKVYQLDSGQLVLAQSPEDYKIDRDYFHIRNRRFHRWLKENYPMLLEHYLSQVNALEDHYQKLMGQQIEELSP